MPRRLSSGCFMLSPKKHNTKYTSADVVTGLGPPKLTSMCGWGRETWKGRKGMREGCAAQNTENCNRQRWYGKLPKINEPMEENMVSVPPMTGSLSSGTKFSSRFTIASLNSNACNRILVVSGAFIWYPITSGILIRIFFRCVSLKFFLWFLSPFSRFSSWWN